MHSINKYLAGSYEMVLILIVLYVQGVDSSLETYMASVGHYEI